MLFIDYSPMGHIGVTQSPMRWLRSVAFRRGPV